MKTTIWKKRMKLAAAATLGASQLFAFGGAQATEALPLDALDALGASPETSSAAAPAHGMRRQMEYLDRGLVAVSTESGVFLNWRLLGYERQDTAFHVYRDGVRLTVDPISDSTNYLDPTGTPASTYKVRAVVDGAEQRPSAAAAVMASNLLRVPLNKPADRPDPDNNGNTITYRANDASVGDLDGDGQYEIVLKWDPSDSRDNLPDGKTGGAFIDAYKLNGTFLWRISLGKNIRSGPHYTQFMVYDLDGDGKSEVAFKTSDGTIDGVGNVIGDPNVDYRTDGGVILEGPEYLTVFEGATGRALATVPFEPARGNVCDWGDCYGNRVDRFLAGIAYLNGETPSLIMARGYYAKSVIVAYDFRDGQLAKRWAFDSTQPGNEGYGGQGNHQLSVGDVDGDGKDEIVYGAMAIDDDGTGMYTTGLGHGDAMHLGDLDPERPGLEVFSVHESRNSQYGASYRDPATGEVLWGVYTGRDTGRGMSADIDPRYAGEEVWAAAGVGLWSNKGTKIGTTVPSSINFGIWWDGDLQRELLDHVWLGNELGTGIPKIDKWDYVTGTTQNVVTLEGTYSNNHTKGTPTLQADLFGDWREEVVVRSQDSSALHVYTTTALTGTKIYTLMHDPMYRLGIAWQNVSYNQPPHPSFFLGYGMSTPPAPAIRVVSPVAVDVDPDAVNLNASGEENAVTVYVEPRGDVSLPDPASVTMLANGRTIAAQVEPTVAGDYDGDGKTDLMVKFDSAQVREAFAGTSGEQIVHIQGTMQDGSGFAGSDTIKIIAH